nr:HD-GYP domain-containing protein [Chloroflexota bacterium]
NTEITIAYDTTLEGWSRALEMRDMETDGHSQRVTEMTMQLAQAMGMSKKELAHVRRGALLHDIGKMGVPDSILHKPGPLTDKEWEIMRQHPVYAYNFLSSIGYLRPALDIPYYHHEKWDGTGYPFGLDGEKIPSPARIFAVVDVWDALSSERPYRDAWPKEEIITHIQEQAGKHFDPRVVEAFLDLLSDNISG